MAPDFDKAKLIPEERERGIEVADPQHGVKVSHKRPFGRMPRRRPAWAGDDFSLPAGNRRHGSNYMIADDCETGIGHGRANSLMRRPSSCPSPGQAFRPSAAFRTFARRAACGLGSGRFRSINSSRARPCAPSSWRRRFAMQEHFVAARPGRGHRALASLHRAGKVPAVVTQNIDNLHQASGFADGAVVELHGNTTYATCLDCARRYELAWVRERFEAQSGRLTAPPAGAISRPRRCRSAKPCRRPRYGAPRRWRNPATCSLPSARRSWLAGRGHSAHRQTRRSPARDSQPRTHRIRRRRRPRDPRRYRAGARTLHRA